MDIRNKVVVVTGASAGIGLATARAAAEAGGKVVLAARSADQLRQLAEELRREGHEALVVPTDMRRQTEVTQLVETAFQHYGRIDVLINNAGQAVAATVAELDLEHYRQVIELNLFGPIYAMQASVPKMRAQGGGLIVNISSMVSKMHIPGLGGYASTKAALNMLSDTARGELAPDNIRVITVYPRMTATDFGRNSLGSRQVRQEQRAHTAPGVVIDSPEDVAGKILEAIQKEPAEQFMDS
jgi:short-subunit dehydrogenase